MPFETYTKDESDLIRSCAEFRSEIRHSYDTGALGLSVFDEANMTGELGDVLRGEWLSVSESVLSRDWDAPGEDEAWDDL